MLSNTVAAGEHRPPIHLSESDYDIIAGLALRMPANAASSSGILDEIDRAEVHPDGDLPHDVVAIGSTVTFLDNSTGSTRTVDLVLPGEADIAAGRVSIMTPVGAGLIGMRIGSEISWPCPDGRPRTLKILSVEQRLSS